MLALPVARGNEPGKALSLRRASSVQLRERDSWTKGKFLNEGASWRQKFVQPFPPRLETTVHRARRLRHVDR
jgi:hypothetical protein